MNRYFGNPEVFENVRYLNEIAASKSRGEWLFYQKEEDEFFSGQMCLFEGDKVFHSFRMFYGFSCPVVHFSRTDYVHVELKTRHLNWYYDRVIFRLPQKFNNSSVEQAFNEIFFYQRETPYLTNLMMILADEKEKGLPIFQFQLVRT